MASGEGPGKIACPTHVLVPFACIATRDSIWTYSRRLRRRRRRRRHHHHRSDFLPSYPAAPAQLARIRRLPGGVIGSCERACVRGYSTERASLLSFFSSFLRSVEARLRNPPCPISQSGPARSFEPLCGSLSPHMGLAVCVCKYVRTRAWIVIYVHCIMRKKTRRRT